MTLNGSNQPFTGGTPTGTPLSTGVISGSTTSWDVSSGVDLVGNMYLFFDVTGGSDEHYTHLTADGGDGDAHLEVAATIIPESSEFVILSIMGVMGLVVRSCRRR